MTILYNYTGAQDEIDKIDSQPIFFINIHPVIYGLQKTPKKSLKIRKNVVELKKRLP